MTLQYNLLAFIASLLRVTDKELLIEITQYDPSSVYAFMRPSVVQAMVLKLRLQIILSVDREDSLTS